MAFSISYIFQAIDDYSGPARAIISQTNKIRHSVQELNEKIKKGAEAAKKMGESFSLYLSTPIIAFGAISLKEFNDAEKAIAQVNTALRSTGNTVGLTSAQLQQAAEQIQKHSLFDHTEVLSQVTAQLLRFKHVTGDTFLSAQQAAVDYSARTGGPLKMAALTIGRALEDPARGALRLRTVGIVLNKSQIEALAQLEKTGHLAQAQGFILEQLKKRYHDAAEAISDAGTGPLEKAKNNFKDLQEQIGKLIWEALAPLLPKIQEFIDYLKALDPHTKNMILKIAGIVAVIGPALIAIASLGFIISGLGTVIALLINPIFLALALLVALSFGFYKAYEASNVFDFAMYAIAAALIAGGIALRFFGGPVAWVVGIIVLIAEGLMYAYKHCKLFREIVLDMKDGIVFAFNAIVDGAEILITKLETLFGLIKKIPLINSLVQTGQLLSQMGEKLPSFDARQSLLNTSSINMLNPLNDRSNLLAVNQYQSKQGMVGININVNDPNNTIRSVETTQATGIASRPNVGRTMSRIP